MSKKCVIVGAGEISGLLSSNMMLSEIGRQDLLAELFALDKQGFAFVELPTYAEETKAAVELLNQEVQINLTSDFADEAIDNNSVAYHRIKGTIRADSMWWHSSKQFVKDLKAADANPRIVAHFVHTNSGGGDAWYNDIVADTMKNLTKPVVNLSERVEASAAFFQTAYATKRYATTPFDTFGSMGTMVSTLNLIPYFEKMGAKWIEEYATNSTEKNARVREMMKGNPERFIKQDLDPLRDNFAETMQDARPALAKLPEDDKIIQGATVYTNEAIEYGLIDGIRTMEEAVTEAYELGMSQRKTQNQNSFFQQEVKQILNS